MDAKVLEKLLKSQQEHFEKMLVRLLKPSEMNDTELYSKLVAMIGEFSFDLTSGMTFESWLGRHRSYFDPPGFDQRYGIYAPIHQQRWLLTN
uniref:Uncharacterized protein n=1 Tax=Meloidogyne enterolobii TaxID=390850 RepID=A0A6V7U4Y7_MELEN|nr:unnamed protein product [Meloidogyne enterolobii]